MRDRSGLPGWPRDVVAVLSALAALLIYFQYTTLFKFAVLGPGHRYESLAAFLQAVRRQDEEQPAPDDPRAVERLLADPQSIADARLVKYVSGVGGLVTQLVAEGPYRRAQRPRIDAPSPAPDRSQQMFVRQYRACVH